MTVHMKKSFVSIRNDKQNGVKFTIIGGYQEDIMRLIIVMRDVNEHGGRLYSRSTGLGSNSGRIILYFVLGLDSVVSVVLRYQPFEPLA